MDDDDDRRYLDWLSGLIDGEGCFTINANSAREHRYYQPRFVISLREDDAAALREARARTGLGVLQRTTGTVGAPGRQPQKRWSIKDKAGCLALVRLLDGHPLRTKKARDFAIWREAVLEWHGRHRADVMIELKQSLEEGRRFRTAHEAEDELVQSLAQRPDRTLW